MLLKVVDMELLEANFVRNYETPQILEAVSGMLIIEIHLLAFS